MGASGDKGNKKENKIENIKETNRKEEGLFVDHMPIPINIVNKVLKCICKISIRKAKGVIYGTGFFMKIDNSKKYLLTNNHIISKKNINNDIEIEIYNEKKLKLTLNDRFIKYYENEKDITIIEIKKDDEIYNDIELLNYDLNYKNGYEIYKNVDIFSVEHPLGKSAACASGKIVNINNYEFDHNIPTDNGSSGCPIILLSNNINIIQVIGIHKLADYNEKLNCGTFIGEIFNKDFDDNNYIIAEIDIKEDDINKNIRILNSYEEQKTIFKFDAKNERNEEEIKMCKIRVNDEIIPFNYFYKFKNEGKYIIKYSYNNFLTKTNFMFFKCEHIKNIDLTNFNTKNVINMSNMFQYCKSLNNINFSNINTQNVIDMSEMFYGCESLVNLDLSYFNIQNVACLSRMFDKCKSLISLDLSNFKTKNVIYMNRMFKDCHSLKNLNLSNFNNKNVTNMKDMFAYCYSLININLSNFNTKNVTNMEGMFSNCESMKNIDLSNFKTKNVTNMECMFAGCENLENLNLSNFNTENVSNMSGMFSGCKSLANIDLCNFNTQNVINMSYMFSNCTSLKNIDLSNFKTQNVTNINSLFSQCSSLENIDLSTFNTQNVTDMNGLFSQCSSLKKVDLSNFTSQNVTQEWRMNFIFSWCDALKFENIICNDKRILKEYKNN